MKFRVSDPCPHCGCKCEEYNDNTGYLGCPQCERHREVSLANDGEYKPPVDWKRRYKELAGTVEYNAYEPAGWIRVLNLIDRNRNYGSTKN